MSKVKVWSHEEKGTKQKQEELWKRSTKKLHKTLKTNKEQGKKYFKAYKGSDLKAEKKKEKTRRHTKVQGVFYMKKEDKRHNIKVRKTKEEGNINIKTKSNILNKKNLRTLKLFKKYLPLL